MTQDLLDMLMSLADFDEFKQLMISFKQNERVDIACKSWKVRFSEVSIDPLVPIVQGNSLSL